MSILEMFENFGFGLGIVIAIIAFLFVVFLLSNLIPVILMHFAGILFFIIAIIFIMAVIYFIGKFAKDFIK